MNRFARLKLKTVVTLRHEVGNNLILNNQASS
jgi:hypothetical protein